MNFHLQTSGEDDEIWNEIGDGLRDFNRRHHAPNWREVVTVCARDDENLLIGGALSVRRGAWMNLEVLWVQDAWRERGVGSALLQRTEDEARARGCIGVFLDTFSFQAPKFYQARGYQPFGELSEPDGITRYFFSKSLTQA